MGMSLRLVNLKLKPNPSLRCADVLDWDWASPPGTVHASTGRLNSDLHQEVRCIWARALVQKEPDVFMHCVHNHLCFQPADAVTYCTAL